MTRITEQYRNAAGQPITGQVAFMPLSGGRVVARPVVTGLGLASATGQIGGGTAGYLEIDLLPGDYKVQEVFIGGATFGVRVGTTDASLYALARVEI